MNKKLYAIKIPFDNTWLYLTEVLEGMDFHTPAIKAFSSIEEAEHTARVWGEKAEIVDFPNFDVSDEDEQ